ncbi:MAG: hypothetical protein NTW75_04425 [Planctomycetales bacterium]|nr:hypothetical protein [Planctomycetales bacterium]
MFSNRHLLLSLIMLMVFGSGCTNILHEFKPHRLHRWNRCAAPSLDPEFSETSKATHLNFVRNPNAKAPIVFANRAEAIIAADHK